MPDGSAQLDVPSGTVKANRAPGTVVELNRVDRRWDNSAGEWVLQKVEDSKDDKKCIISPEYAFTLVRSFEPTKDDKVQDVSTAIQIRSPYFPKVGAEVMAGNRSLPTALPLTFKPEDLLAFFPEFESYLTRLEKKTTPGPDDRSTIEHLSFFIRFMNREYAELISQIRILRSHHTMTFELGWACYRPGTMIVFHCPVSTRPRVGRILSASIVQRPGDPKMWVIRCEYVDSQDGYIGLAMTSVRVCEFEGTMRVENLDAVPLHMHPQEAFLRSTLIERGRKWSSLVRKHHRRYDAIAYREVHNKQGRVEYKKSQVNGRIMIDKGLYTLHAPAHEPPELLLTLGLEGLRGYRIRGPLAVAPIKAPLPEDYLMATPLLYGFSLSSRMWLIFDVNDIQEIQWNNEIFDNMDLNQDQKDMVRSLVAVHKMQTDFDDFVEGKGRGLIFDLYGPAGVGKTLTAEATSEYTRRPLYVVGAGDLGSKAEILDRELTKIFAVSSAWGAVVLIDEADVFLEQRSTHDLDRNAMVAVFLRQLEYFPGILFLTTNRVAAFDEAIQSRIHVSLYYSELSQESKRRIWAAFLHKTGAVKIEPSLLDQLSTLNMNGRQIKNAVKTASLLALHEKTSLEERHLLAVRSIVEDFDTRMRESRKPSVLQEITRLWTPSQMFVVVAFCFVVLQQIAQLMH